MPRKFFYGNKFTSVFGVLCCNTLFYYYEERFFQLGGIIFPCMGNNLPHCGVVCCRLKISKDEFTGLLKTGAAAVSPRPRRRLPPDGRRNLFRAPGNRPNPPVSFRRSAVPCAREKKGREGPPPGLRGSIRPGVSRGVLFYRKTASTRRLCCLPSAVLLSAIGFDNPYPTEEILDASTPSFPTR